MFTWNIIKSCQKLCTIIKSFLIWSTTSNIYFLKCLQIVGFSKNKSFLSVLKAIERIFFWSGVGYWEILFSWTVWYCWKSSLGTISPRASRWIILKLIIFASLKCLSVLQRKFSHLCWLYQVKSPSLSYHLRSYGTNCGT